MVELLVRGQVIPRYYASESGTSIVLDTVGEANGPPESVVIFDASCNELERLDRDLTDGALIVLLEEGNARVELGRESTDSRRGPDEDFGQVTCEVASADLR